MRSILAKSGCYLCVSPTIKKEDISQIIFDDKNMVFGSESGVVLFNKASDKDKTRKSHVKVGKNALIVYRAKLEEFRKLDLYFTCSFIISKTENAFRNSIQDSFCFNDELRLWGYAEDVREFHRRLNS
jgi:hypothetical protein